MQIGIRHQREEARTIDRNRKLPLVACLGARDAGRNDPPVLVDEFLEDPDILVIDFLGTVGGEAAELPAPEQLVAAARVASLALDELALAFALAAASSAAASRHALSCHRHDLFLYRPCF